MNNARKLLVFGAASASVGYIFSIASGSIGLLLFIATWLLNYRALNFKALLSSSNLYWLLSFFLILLLDVFYSIDIKQGQKDIVRHLPFIVSPLIFLTIQPFKKKERLLIIKIFTHSISIFFIICSVTAIIRQIGFWDRGGVFNWYYFYRYDFLEILEQHPTYLSMFTLLSLSFLLFLKRQVIYSRKLFYITVILQGLAVILYGSRIGYIILFLLSAIFIFKNIVSGKKGRRIQFIAISSFCIMAISLLVYNIPIVKERILYTLGYKYDYKFNNKEFIEDKAPEEQGRLLLWQDAIELIKKRPVFGYGTGSAREVLLKKYQEKGQMLFLQKRFNAHNSYLELLLNGGIILLASYLALIFVLFVKSVRKRDFVLLSFAIIIAITSITETIFIAQGILFLSFFYCFLQTPINEE